MTGYNPGCSCYRHHILRIADRFDCALCLSIGVVAILQQKEAAETSDKDVPADDSCAGDYL